MHIRSIALAATLLSLANSPARGENWPRFRGPTGQGISTDKHLPTTWSATRNLAWKTEIAGEGWSSPIVWEKQVFVTSTEEHGRSCHVISVDRDSGEVLWDVEVFTETPTRKEGRNSFATPTPVTDGQRVYAFFGGGGAAAIDFAGHVVWTNTDNHFYSQHGLGSSPIVYGDLLLMPWDHSAEGGPDPKIGWQIPWDQAFVLALDTTTGQPRYKAKRGLTRIGHMTPAIIKIEGRPQLVSGTGDAVEGFDPESGELLWWVHSGGEGVTPSPVFGDGVVFSSSGFPTPVGGKQYHAAIRAFRLGGQGDMTKANLVWEQRSSPPMIPSLLLVEKLLYSIKEDGIFQCLDAATGDVIYRQRLGGTFSASPVFAGGMIYLVSDEGKTSVVKAGRKFDRVAVNELGERCQASPAISDGRLLIRGEKHLYCLAESGDAAR
jgi:outer membrane protein assembly factor BamB